jgi:hypothetical protein
MLYTKTITYEFEAGGERFAITSVHNGIVTFEETRKNSQEDEHYYGELALVDGAWALTDYPRRECVRQYGEDTAAAIEAYLNQHGPPAFTTEES